MFETKLELFSIDPVVSARRRLVQEQAALAMQTILPPVKAKRFYESRATQTEQAPLSGGGINVWLARSPGVEANETVYLYAARQHFARRLLVFAPTSKQLRLPELTVASDIDRLDEAVFLNGMYRLGCCLAAIAEVQHVEVDLSSLGAFES